MIIEINLFINHYFSITLYHLKQSQILRFLQIVVQIPQVKQQLLPYLSSTGTISYSLPITMYQENTILLESTTGKHNVIKENLEVTMHNKIINIAAKEAISSNIDEIIRNEIFFKEYFKIFYNNKVFDNDVIKYINENIKLDTISYLLEKLIKIFKEKLIILSKLHIENEIGLILFIGDGKIDGHSIILNNSVYVFIDLTALISRSNYNCDLDSFVSHEIIHAIHYKLNKEFYNKNCNIMKDVYLKTLIVEGIATYMNIHIFGVSKDLSYWLGLMNSNKIEEWKNNCEKLKFSVGKSLNNIITNEKFDNNLYEKLFCIKKHEKLTLYRIGYYYGSEIIKNICKDISITEIFNINYEGMIDYINSYFKTIIIRRR